MSYLKMALAALQATTSVGDAGEQRCGFASQAPNHTPAAEAPQASPPGCPATCEPCPWYALNPWTRDPALGAWCHYRMGHLVVGSAACEEFRRGEVPPRQPYEQVPAIPAATERILTCFECPRHEHDTVNPPEGWGLCTLKNRGCYGLRPACETAFDFPDVEKYCASPWCRYYRPKQYPGGDTNDGFCEHPALDHDRENFNEELVKLRGEKHSRYARENRPDWIPNMKRCPKD